MKINIMSDLHLEFGGYFEPPKSDVLILAGDIGVAKKVDSTITYFVKDAAENTEHVLMIMGNHEHYGGNINTSYDIIKESLHTVENFHLLENEHIVIDDVAFIGATFWSDIYDDIARNIIRYKMNDYHVIHKNTRPLVPEDTMDIHFKSSDYIFKMVKEFKDQDYKTFVLTHHNPTLRMAKQYRNDLISLAYATDYEEWIEENGPNVWVYGHTHISHEFVIGTTQIICNPRGYVGYEVNPEFDPAKMIEL